MVVSAGIGAEDCVVIRSANAGGTGDGPGRVYFSVPRAGAAGLIGIININPASPAAPIQTGVGALASIELRSCLRPYCRNLHCANCSPGRILMR